MSSSNNTPRIQISLSKSTSGTGTANASTSATATPQPSSSSLLGNNNKLYKSVRKALKNQTLNFKINVECKFKSSRMKWKFNKASFVLSFRVVWSIYISPIFISLSVSFEFVFVLYFLNIDLYFWSIDRFTFNFNFKKSRTKQKLTTIHFILPSIFN